MQIQGGKDVVKVSLFKVFGVSNGFLFGFGGVRVSRPVAYGGASADCHPQHGTNFNADLGTGGVSDAGGDDRPAGDARQFPDR
jgi:hypothetical protein